MRKTIFVFFIALVMLMSISVTALAANEISLDFLDTEWSESNPYPEWYGGRYIDDNNSRILTYVIVKGHEEEVGAFLSENTCIIKEHSYNTLMRTLDEITREWMSIQTSDEIVCIQSAWIDEVNNIITVEFYTGSDKVEDTRARLTEHFGALVNTSTTDDLITLESKLVDRVDNTWILFTVVAIMMALIGTAFIWRKRTSLVYARQAVGSGTIEETSTMSTDAVVSAVKEATITPSESVFEGIMRDIRK